MHEARGAYTDYNAAVQEAFELVCIAQSTNMDDSHLDRASCKGKPMRGNKQKRYTVMYPFVLS